MRKFLLTLGLLASLITPSVAQVANDFGPGPVPVGTPLPWTCTLTGSTTNPTVTYTSQVCYYLKVGKQVTVWYNIAWSAFSGGSGAVLISTLPFGSSSVGGLGSGGIQNYQGITLGVGNTQLMPGIGASSSTIALISAGTAVNSTVLSVTALGASGTVVGTTTYFTN